MSESIRYQWQLQGLHSPHHGTYDKRWYINPGGILDAYLETQVGIIQQSKPAWCPGYTNPAQPAYKQATKSVPAASAAPPQSSASS